MPATSFAELLQSMRTRITAITNNLTDMAKAGVQQADVDEGSSLVSQMDTLDAEQEALKAELKSKTAELNEAKKAARQWRSRMDKRIKIAYEDQSEKWVGFGITAKK